MVHSLKAFLVEDSALIRENLIAALEELTPVEVVGAAEDESTAVRWLSQSATDIDLLIVDVFLKSGSGLSVLAAARGEGHAKRVVLSNYATQDMRQKCLALGAHKVFDKSNEVDELLTYCSGLAHGTEPSPA